ncbi:MAG: quinol:cytochrome C oxidoreductase [Bacteroidia bacterium]|nr:quinol:cytochrome C oxidoreductase [Bacteroidia bacterium]NNF30539.1 quinol:cytochrome C oxidoreductase [Flavobacteriaceae bacterium]MBT8277127.1 quinol:cytochrome C oxidoreductase [Bacteroidia bacterium]NNJ81053.1 quinol:cytochrome C oxidoreductase [Flavobacteriaceae bacterium]NNK53886.1 quinol:cytochrome C oxidoreductase [Flavobacteriaceae bacterium]
MYTLPNKLKLFAIIFMVVGAVGIVSGFLMAPKTTSEVKEMMADGHGDGHEGDHAVADESHSVAQAEEAHDDEAHYEHVLHQMQNRPWSALYIASFFFFMIALGTLAFYAIQYAAQAGWSPVLFRVMEGITAYLPVASVIIIVLLLLSAFHMNHIFHWMDPELVNPESEHYDKLIAGKSGFLNVPFFLIRALIFLGGWNLYRYISRRNSLRDDNAEDNRWFKKNFKASAGFLVFFIVTESMMSWDWIMSFDPHWFSTLFGWYVFAGMMVSAITVIAMVTIVLKSQGYLEHVNDSHIHDLAKYMFGFSIFWTYLWFSQFMLIWYSNIPEEVTYFVTRIEDYNLLFFGMVVMNFVFPVLMLMNSDYKRVNWFVILTGIVILVGHYIDVFNMVMPATVGASWFVGLPEIGAVMFFFGLFVLVVFSALTKAPLLVKHNPFIKESKHFHY